MIRSLWRPGVILPFGITSLKWAFFERETRLPSRNTTTLFRPAERTPILSDSPPGTQPCAGGGPAIETGGPCGVGPMVATHVDWWVWHANPFMPVGFVGHPLKTPPTLLYGSPLNEACASSRTM